MKLREVKYRYPMKDSEPQKGWLHKIDFKHFGVTIETEEGELIYMETDCIRFTSPPYQDMPLVHKVSGDELCQQS